jgi:2-iminobutanoate/2-iminopropanoate deaminase
MPKEIIASPVPGFDLQKIYGHHQSVATRANGLIFVSGMLAVDPETGDRLNGTVASETHQIFKNLKTLLESAGSSLQQIVQVHALIYDRIEYDTLNRVYEKYLSHLPPARTAWSVKIESGFKVQLDIIAAA